MVPSSPLQAGGASASTLLALSRLGRERLLEKMLCMSLPEASRDPMRSASSRSFVPTKLVTRPALPIRAVRPTRCSQQTALVGIWKFTTWSTSAQSMPRPPNSVATRTFASPSAKRCASLKRGPIRPSGPFMKLTTGQSASRRNLDNTWQLCRLFTKTSVRSQGVLLNTSSNWSTRRSQSSLPGSHRTQSSLMPAGRRWKFCVSTVCAVQKRSISMLPALNGPMCNIVAAAKTNCVGIRSGSLLRGSSAWRIFTRGRSAPKMSKR
mmetsp:Transcript_88644/g.287032  ORF Transcript_88644/g.287032 Transcript_88644/m.287032 type:complete len:265 (+) Transcript_88644:502-1296(+)